MKPLRQLVRLITIATACLLCIASFSPSAYPQTVIPDPPIVDIPATDTPEPERVAPYGSRCPDLYAIALDNWPNAEDVWFTLDYIFWRESRCRANVVNRSGCVGVMQICRGNHRRLGESRESLKDAATNIATGYRLFVESQRYGRSGWRPWHTRGFRP